MPFLAEYNNMISNALESRAASAAFTMQLNEEEVFAFMSPLGIGEPAFYLATVPKSTELKILSVLQQNTILIAVISFLITILFAFILGKTLTRPILKLVTGMKKVSDGDLSVTVHNKSHDEIGLLTHAAAHGAAQHRHRLEARMRVRRNDVVRRKLEAQDEQARLRRVAMQHHRLRAFRERGIVLEDDLAWNELVWRLGDVVGAHTVVVLDAIGERHRRRVGVDVADVAGEKLAVARHREAHAQVVGADARDEVTKAGPVGGDGVRDVLPADVEAGPIGHRA